MLTLSYFDPKKQYLLRCPGEEHASYSSNNGIQSELGGPMVTHGRSIFHPFHPNVQTTWASQRTNVRWMPLPWIPYTMDINSKSEQRSTLSLLWASDDCPCSNLVCKWSRKHALVLHNAIELDLCSAWRRLFRCASRSGWCGPAMLNSPGSGIGPTGLTHGWWHA